MKSYILETSRGNLYYQMGGVGEPLLFIHGNGEDSDIFSIQFEDFQPTHTVIAMDTRGHGRSDLGVDTLTFRLIADDILTLLDELAIEKIIIVGYSDGGNIALYLAAHNPERVRCVITMGSNYKADAIEKTTYQEIVEHREELLTQEQNEEVKRQLNIVNLMLDELDLSENDLKNLQVPVLVMAGEFDLIKREHTEEMAALIPNGEVFIVPEGGHDFFVTDPGSFQEAVNLFFEKLEDNEI
ncbi:MULTISPECIES: alpha/beta fold hydrolase [unclassified Jeotgalibaca]|uniref:alpha/beta fold hydrolase n=1 Tax=unclassified Jeotgalibaca TaxID=2621505 RepID=UPI003FD3A72C